MVSKTSFMNWLVGWSGYHAPIHDSKSVTSPSRNQRSRRSNSSRIRISWRPALFKLTRPRRISSKIYTSLWGLQFLQGGRPMANNIINNAPQMHRNFHIYILYFVYINHETKQYDVPILRWSYPRLNVQIFAFVNATSIRVGQIFLCAGWQLLLQIKQFALT